MVQSKKKENNKHQSKKKVEISQIDKVLFDKLFCLKAKKEEERKWKRSRIVLLTQRQGQNFIFSQLEKNLKPKQRKKRANRRDD